MTTTSTPTAGYLRSDAISFEEDVDWMKLPEGYEFPEAGGVAVDASDNVYIFNRGPHPVIVLDKQGNFLRSFGEDVYKGREHGISIAPDGFVWCVDDSLHCVHKFTPEGELVWTLGESGKPAPKWSNQPFNRPTHAAVSPKSGDIFVTDGYGNSAVHRFSPDGQLKLSWGQVGTDPGEFCNPHNVVIDDDENVFVADRENNRVQVFDGNGQLQHVWNQVYKADGMCRGADGTLYIGELVGAHDTNSLGHRITILDGEGKRIARLGDPAPGDAPGQFNAIHGCAVDSQDTLYIAEVSYTMRGRREDPPRVYKSLRRLRRV